MIKKVCVVFFSGSGHTAVMAESVKSGVESVSGCEAGFIQLSGNDIKDGQWQNNEALEMLDEADAIIFGTPTYMSNVSAQMKAFMDSTGERFFSQKWKNKIASGFTVSGGPSGDKLNTLMTLATFAMQHGMIWVGLGLTSVEKDGTNRLGFFLGAGGQALMEPPSEAPNQVDKDTGSKLGIRVAETCLRFT